MKPLQLDRITITNLNGHTPDQLRFAIPDRDYRCIDMNLRIPVNFGIGIETVMDGKNYTFKRAGYKPEPIVELDIETWGGISIGAMHYYGTLKINMPEMIREEKDGSWSTSCYDIPMFKNNKIQLTQVLEQWEKEKYPENYEYIRVGEHHTGFYTKKQIYDYAPKVFKQIFEEGWIFKINER